MIGVLLTALVSSALAPSVAAGFECQPGRYVGKAWSVNEAYHNKEVNVTVMKKGEACEFRFKGPSTAADEIWELSGNKLVQRELDAAGKEKLSYGATLEVRRGVEGYYVNCGKGGTSACDAGVDPRHYWRVENKNGRIVYSLWGVDPERAGDPRAAARKRIEYTFTPAP